MWKPALPHNTLGGEGGTAGNPLTAAPLSDTLQNILEVSRTASTPPFRPYRANPAACTRTPTSSRQNFSGRNGSLRACRPRSSHFGIVREGIEYNLPLDNPSHAPRRLNRKSSKKSFYFINIRYNLFHNVCWKPNNFSNTIGSDHYNRGKR